ncbi:OmpA family protein [Dyella jejuensis]|uniref:OmpA family protein n=1 Tax=Dyella jejuensis TaxID=1432009 RepID=A0ABW8JHE1_9GAMM
MSAVTPKSSRRHEETIVKKVSRRAQHEDHGGNWKVAFADFCLALLCLFLVLWVLGARDEEEVRRKFGVSVVYDGGTGIFDGDSARPVPPAVVEPLADAALAQDSGDDAAPRQYETREDLKKLAATVERLGREANLENNLQAVVTPTGLRVILHDTHRRGIFEFGSAVPDQRFDQLMQRMGQLFAQVGNSLLVVGHTDAVPFRNPAVRSNWHLSGERAMAARTSLMQGGMPISHLLQVVGMADRAPMDTDDPHGAMNRRIEFLVLTRERAKMIEQMFGAPQSVTPLIEGVDAVQSRDGGAAEDA